MSVQKGEASGGERSTESISCLCRFPLLVLPFGYCFDYYKTHLFEGNRLSTKLPRVGEASRPTQHRNTETSNRTCRPSTMARWTPSTSGLRAQPRTRPYGHTLTASSSSARRGTPSYPATPKILLATLWRVAFHPSPQETLSTWPPASPTALEPPWPFSGTSRTCPYRPPPLGGTWHAVSSSRYSRRTGSSRPSGVTPA